MTAILRGRALLAEQLSEFIGSAPRASQFDRLVRIVYEALPGDIDCGTLEDSLRSLAGVVMTSELATATAWRMWGNVTRLSHRKAVPPWHGQHLHEWVPLHVLSAKFARSPYGRIGCTFGFRVLAGTPAGLMTWKWWSLAQCRFYARYFGHSRPKSVNSRLPARYLYSHPTQLVTLRLYGLIDPDESHREPVFSKVAWPSAVADWNKGQIKARARIDPGYTCPRKFPNAIECYRCPAGYTVCRAGTHRLEYEFRPCPKCGGASEAFDPELPGGVCVNCFVRGVYRGE